MSVSITGLMELCPTLFTEIYYLSPSPVGSALNFHNDIKHFYRILIESMNFKVWVFCDFPVLLTVTLNADCGLHG